MRTCRVEIKVKIKMIQYVPICKFIILQLLVHITGRKEPLHYEIYIQ